MARVLPVTAENDIYAVEPEAGDKYATYIGQCIDMRSSIPTNLSSYSIHLLPTGLLEHKFNKEFSKAFLQKIGKIMRKKKLNILL